MKVLGTGDDSWVPECNIVEVTELRVDQMAALHYLNDNPMLHHMVEQIRVERQANFLSSGTARGSSFSGDHNSPLVIGVSHLQPT